MVKNKIYFENAAFLLLDKYESNPEEAGEVVADIFKNITESLYPATGDEFYKQGMEKLREEWRNRFKGSLIKNL